MLKMGRWGERRREKKKKNTKKKGREKKNQEKQKGKCESGKKSWSVGRELRGRNNGEWLRHVGKGNG